MLFFFFKQKTAYEMRISDWGSDACSSDLGPGRRRGRGCASSSDRSCVSVEIQSVGDRPECGRGRRHDDAVGTCTHGPEIFRTATWRLPPEARTARLLWPSSHTYIFRCKFSEYIINVGCVACYTDVTMRHLQRGMHTSGLHQDRTDYYASGVVG